MRIDNEIKLDFSDVLIRPKRSNLTSRATVDLERDFGFFQGIPIIAANMDTTGTMAVAAVLEKHKMLTCLHKHYEVDVLCEHFNQRRNHTAYSMGITDDDLTKWRLVKDRITPGNLQFVCIDVANGYTERFIDFVKRFRDKNPDLTVIAGNVATGDITEQLVLAGAGIVKVGIGPGSVCTTRIKTGVGYPQLSAIIECSDAAHGLGGRIVADGGCASAGDVVKAFGANADFVMVGGMFAGHTESGGELIEEEGQQYKMFYGMSSGLANDMYAGGLEDYKAAEGRTVKVPYKGAIEGTVQDILGGLRSACTYVGARELRELSKCTTFVRVNNTHNRVFEDSET